MNSKSNNWLRDASWKAFFTVVIFCSLMAFVINFDDNLIQNTSSSTTVKIWAPAKMTIVDGKKFDDIWTRHLSVSHLMPDSFQKAFGGDKVDVLLTSHGAVYGAFLNDVYFTTAMNYGISGDPTYLGKGWVRVDGTDVGVVKNISTSLALAAVAAVISSAVYGVLYMFYLEDRIWDIDRKKSKAKEEAKQAQASLA
ncbi:MAG TPA: hypothetical protein VFT82_00940 [Candidatus Paceibacterota bacterium]|nr:hypothetical protein [Candidatus Paceibacterota bacterium]